MPWRSSSSLEMGRRPKPIGPALTEVLSGISDIERVMREEGLLQDSPRAS